MGGFGGEPRGGREPLVYFCELGFGVGYVGEGRHFCCSGERGGEPDGAGEEPCGEQRGGWW